MRLPSEWTACSGFHVVARELSRSRDLDTCCLGSLGAGPDIAGQSGDGGGQTRKSELPRRLNYVAAALTARPDGPRQRSRNSKRGKRRGHCAILRRVFYGGARRVRCNFRKRDMKHGSEHRGTVVGAFQEVPETVLGWRLSTTRRSQAQAVDASRRQTGHCNLALVGGLVKYLDVVNAQHNVLSNENRKPPSSMAAARHRRDSCKSAGRRWMPQERAVQEKTPLKGHRRALTRTRLPLRQHHSNPQTARAFEMSVVNHLFGKDGSLFQKQGFPSRYSHRCLLSSMKNRQCRLSRLS